MSTVITAHGDGADRMGHGALRTVSPLPNYPVVKQTREGV